MTKKEEVQVCQGCGGDCPNCDGTVQQTQGSGRPRKHCCYNCRGRQSARNYYRRNFKALTPEEKRKDDSKDLARMIDGHKRAGHDGEPCPKPMMGSEDSCRVLARLMDDLREEKGLNRMFEEMTG